MRILLVNDYGFSHGGVERHLGLLRMALRARGHQVRLFASRAGLGGGASCLADDLCLGTTSRFRTLLQSANPWAALALRRVLVQFRPDVVHVNVFLTQLSPLILPVLRGVPCLFHAHWQRAVCPSGTRLLPDGSICRAPAGLVCYRGGCLPLRDWLPLMLQMRWLERWRGAIDAIVASSYALRLRLEESGWRPVEVIPLGIPDAPARSPLEDPPRVAFAGRLVAEKGVAVLLRAFREVVRRSPAAALDIAGDGPAAPALRALARELALDGHVVFHGWLPPDEMERRLARAWVQAVPSIWEEPFGLVAAEAAMRGTAVVASDTGGLREIVSHQRTGLLVPAGDAQALADQLTALVENRERAEQLGREARAEARRRFDFDAYADRICSVYFRLQA